MSISSAYSPHIDYSARPDYHRSYAVHSEPEGYCASGECVDDFSEGCGTVFSYIGTGLLAVASAIAAVVRVIIVVVMFPFILIGMLFQTIAGSCASCTSDSDAATTGPASTGVAGTMRGLGEFIRNGSIAGEVRFAGDTSGANARNIDPAVAAVARNYTLNEYHKADLPQRIDWNALLTARDTRAVTIEQLMTCFNATYRAGDADFEDAGLDRTEVEALRYGIQRYVSFTNMGTDDSPYYTQLRLVLKNLIFEMRKPDMSFDDKHQIFTALADAIGSCDPRKLEEPQRQFLRVIHRPESIRNLVLGWLQQLKEDLITTHFQNPRNGGNHFNVISNARSKMQHWGLEPTQNDPYVNLYDHSVAEYEAVLRRGYLVSTMIGCVANHLDMEGEHELINTFLREPYSDGRLDDDTMAAMYDHYTDADGRPATKLNAFGIGKLLEFLELLDRVAVAAPAA